MCSQRSTPSALAPSEDQGYVIAIAALPPAASLQRTDAVLEQLDQAAFAHPAYRRQLHRQRLRRADGGQRTNAGVSFVMLKDWSERNDAGAVVAAPSPAL